MAINLVSVVLDDKPPSSWSFGPYAGAFMSNNEFFALREQIAWRLHFNEMSYTDVAKALRLKGGAQRARVLAERHQRRLDRQLPAVLRETRV